MDVSKTKQANEIEKPSAAFTARNHVLCLAVIDARHNFVLCQRCFAESMSVDKRKLVK